MRQSLYAYCRQFHKDALLTEWDNTRSLPLTPETVSYGSHRKVWWRCANGHEWTAPVYSRTGGAGCPYCTGRRVGQNNDFASLYPGLSAQWDAEKNAPLTPEMVTAGSQRLVWWRCEKGHSWRAQVRSRVSGCGCPVCAGKLAVAGENTLADVAPNLAAQWDAEKNAPLTPEMVTAGTRRKVWWRCGQGHSYAAVIASRTARGTGCPYCANRKVLPGFNDLAAVKPKIAEQWHPTLNGNLTPGMVTAGSHRRVWWQCPLGHVWKAAIYSRTGSQKCGCPVCAGKFDGSRRARYEQILQEAMSRL